MMDDISNQQRPVGAHSREQSDAPLHTDLYSGEWARHALPLHTTPMVLILLLGFVVMMHGLTAQSLWADEGWTIAATAEANPVEVVTQWVAVDVHPPLFFIGLNIWRMFTGDTIFEMRYYSVLLTMLGIVLVYRLGMALFAHNPVRAKHASPLHHDNNDKTRKAHSHKRSDAPLQDDDAQTRTQYIAPLHTVGLIAALLYALHDLVNILTQEVRHYPQQMLMTTLAVWLYWRFWQNPTRNRGIAFVLGAAALLYSHYWGGFVLLAMALHALITRRQDLSRFVLAFAGIGLFYLPWLPVLVHQVTLERPGGLPHALENTPWVYAVLTYQLLGRPELLWTILAFIGAMGAFAAKPIRWLPRPNNLLPLLIVTLTPALSILLNVFYPTLSFRALAVVVPIVIVLAANGLAQFRPRERFVMLAFILLFSLSTHNVGEIQRAPWPQLAAYLADHTTDDDAILIELDTDEYAFVYHLEDLQSGVEYIYSQHQRDYEPDTYAAFMQAVMAENDGLWIAKLGWPGAEGEYDIRGDLFAAGYVETMAEWQYDFYIDRPIFLWRMDRPILDVPLTTFGDELRLYQVESEAHHNGVVVNMLWSPQVPPTQEYTISVILFGADRNVNVDTRPLDGRSLTSTWQAGGWYFDSRFISVEQLAPGDYRVGVQMYSFDEAGNLQQVQPDDCSDDPEQCRYVIVGDVRVE